MKFASTAALVAALVLSGCAATGPKFQAQEAAMPKLGADQGRVYFYRVDSFVGGGVRPSIKFDGGVVGDSVPGGYFFVDTAAGSHEASTSTEATNKLTFVVDKGETKYVRTKVQMGLLVGHVVPELVSADEAAKELPALSFTGSPKAN